MGGNISSRIVFLGTGGDSYVVGRQLRTSGGILVQVGADQYLLDPGPGCLVMAKQADINLRATTAVLVSHNHLNHANDVNAVIDAMTYGGFDKKGVLVAAASLFEGSFNFAPYVQDFYKDCVEKVIVMEPGKKVGINNTDIVAIKAKHADKHALGYRLITPDFTLTYAGDTSYSVECVAEYANSNILILNVPHLKKDEGREDLCVDDAVKIISKVKPQLTIITHFGINFLKADPVYIVREIQKATQCQVVAAKDGMVINPLSYAVEQGQKTLYKYAEEKGIRVREGIAAHEAAVKEVNELIDEKQMHLAGETGEEKPTIKESRSETGTVEEKQETETTIEEKTVEPENNDQEEITTEEKKENSEDSAAMEETTTAESSRDKETSEEEKETLQVEPGNVDDDPQPDEEEQEITAEPEEKEVGTLEQETTVPEETQSVEEAERDIEELDSKIAEEEKDEPASASEEDKVEQAEHSIDDLQSEIQGEDKKEN